MTRGLWVTTLQGESLVTLSQTGISCFPKGLQGPVVLQGQSAPARPVAMRRPKARKVPGPDSDC